MSAETNHLAALERKHHELKMTIQTEERRPSADDAHLTDLKKRKLAIKDELERFRAAPTRH